MSAKLKIGDKLRPWGGIHYDTLGFFCADDDSGTLLATCDHVIKTLSTPDEGPQKVYYPFGNEYTKKIALYEGRSLVSKGNKIADLALARVVIEIESTTALPVPIPSTNVSEIQSLITPAKGDEVMLWGARTATYHPGVVLKTNSAHSWQHPKYGLVKYEKQFSVVIGSEFTPEIGDSGGYVISPEGELVVIIAALSGTVSDAGNTVIHCVPVKECCELLCVKPVIKSEQEE